MLAADVWDYIVVGGSLAGSVVSSRLLALNSDAKILVIEAGPDAGDRSDILYANSTSLVGGDFDWNYDSVPQESLNNRKVQSAAGKALGGGSVINTCGWMRGSKVDFDEWASLANDSRWSYDGLLPYFKSTESFWNNSTTRGQHGYDGPLEVEVPSTTGRVYPLRDAVFNSYEAVGIEALPGLDANAGNNLGFGEIAENRRSGKRQIASEYYQLNGITVLTESLVKRILLEDVATDHESSNGNRVTATGVRLMNGTEFRGREIIASAGSYRTPQLLMLSGIGPAEVLSGFDIEQKLDAPEVGQGLADHLFFTTEWKLAPEYRMDTVDSGNPMFSEPQYELGQTNNFVASYGVSNLSGLAQAISNDEGQTPQPDTHRLLKETRKFFEAFMLYTNFDPTLPTNSSYLTAANVGLLPTSRGSVSINSTDPAVPPVINPDLFSSEVGRFVWRDGLRKTIKMMVGGESPLSQGIVVGEAPPAGLPALTVGSTDDEIDARIRATAMQVTTATTKTYQIPTGTS